MNKNFLYRTFNATILVVVMFIGVVSAEAQPNSTSEDKYVSPYSIEFTYSDAELIGDILSGERGNPKLESDIPYSQWDSEHVRKSYGAWGPTMRSYHEPESAKTATIQWKQQRLIAVARRFIGYKYQHHHIPDWQPPENWPWLAIKNSYNSKGVDCSNFTTFYYSQALGIRLNGEIVTQSKTQSAPITGTDKTIQPIVISASSDFAELTSQLETGDLLYIQSRNKVVHVITWIGKIGKSPDNNYLVIDSTGDGHLDANHVSIPDGVHLRPFTKESWYFKGFDHALRFVY
ncbi:MAG: NlpC/P60 family protein [Negativicutes bacterium]